MADETKKKLEIDHPKAFRQATGQSPMPSGVGGTGGEGDDAELYDDEIQAFQFKVRKLWNKYGMQASLTLLIVASVWTGYRLYKQRQFEAHQRAYLSLSQATSPEACAAAAQEFDLPEYQAQAYLKAADLLLKKPLSGDPAASQPAETSAEDRSRELDQAKAYYEKTLAIISTGPYAADATLGLAAIAESLRDFQTAEKLYKQVIDQSRTSMPVIASKAQTRIEWLSRLTQPVLFGPSSSAMPAATIAPADNAPATAPATN